MAYFPSDRVGERAKLRNQYRQIRDVGCDPGPHANQATSTRGASAAQNDFHLAPRMKMPPRHDLSIRQDICEDQ